MSVADERRRHSCRARRPIRRCAVPPAKLPITSHPEWMTARAFCCAGCVAGGPCICISDATANVTQGGAVGTAFGTAGWPIDVRVMNHLLARIERMAGDPLDRDDSDHLRRLDTLRGHCGAVSVTFDPDVAAIGRRVTIQGEDERTESFWLALPGDEHATADTISIAAPSGPIGGRRSSRRCRLFRDGRTPALGRRAACGLIWRMTPTHWTATGPAYAGPVMELRSAIRSGSLAWAALGLIDTPCSASELADRFAAEGASIQPGRATELLEELVGLGVVRINEAGISPRYIRTPLGDQMAAGRDH